MLGHGRRRHSAKAEKPLSKTEDKIRCAREDALNASECEELLSGCRSLLDNLVVRIPPYILYSNGKSVGCIVDVIP